MFRLLWLITCLAVVEGRGEPAKIRYVAIGDSYSIGDGASPNESWPARLTRHLNAQGLPVDLVANPSRTGWTTQQAIDRELPVLVNMAPNFATLQIGVIFPVAHQMVAE